MRLSPFHRVRARPLFLISICLTILALVLFQARRQHAASIVVNSTSDVANSSDGLCTLREAITAANSNVASGASAGECVAGSSSGSDSIDATVVTGIINLTGVLPNIGSSLTINGPGSGSLTVRRDTGQLPDLHYQQRERRYCRHDDYQRHDGGTDKPDRLWCPLRRWDSTS